MNEPTKDIQIGDIRYQLGRFTARDGSWVLGQFLARGLVAGLGNVDESKETIEKQIALMLSMAFAEIDERVYASIQNKCFSVIKRYDQQAENTVAMPLLMASGGFTGKEPDALSASTLMMACLAFNLAPFFDPGALTTLKTVYPDLKQLSSAK